MDRTSSTDFYEEFHLTEKQELMSIKNSKVIGRQHKNFRSNATRIITRERKLGFHVSTKKFNPATALQNAYENTSLEVADFPSDKNKFERDIFYEQDITFGQSFDEIKDLLYGPESRLRSFDSLISIKLSEQNKKIINSYGARTSFNLKSFDISIELRDKNTKQLIMLNEINSKHLNDFNKFATHLSKVPFIQPDNLSIEGFIISPLVVSEMLYPIQNFLMNDIVVSERINKNITLTETNEGLFTIPFDDEAIQTRKKMIYQNGEVNHNDFKDLTNGISTGNGFRKDYRRKPNVSSLIWEISPGKHLLSDLMNTCEKLVLIDNVIQGYIDPISGFYIARVISSFLVERGEIKGILPPFKIIADPVAIFEDPELLITAETKYTEGSMYHLPYFLTRKIDVLD